MLFTSLSFIGFLSLLFLVYYFVPIRFRWMLLLVCSAGFYAFAGLSGFLFIGVTIVTTYGAGYFIGRIYEKQATWLAAEGKIGYAGGKKSIQRSRKEKNAPVSDPLSCH